MKIREMVLALRLEHRFSKREVLALYLNLAAYGNQTAGAGRASQLYFGVDPSMLTPAQAAFLAALPQRPSAFNPLKNIASARVRQQTVLRRMAAAGALSPERLREARAEQVALRPGSGRSARRTSWKWWGSRLRQVRQAPAGERARPPGSSPRSTSISSARSKGSSRTSVSR